MLKMDFIMQTLNVFAKNMFSENFLYTPHDVYKTSKFYEKILEETKSVYFRHFEDKGM